MPEQDPTVYFNMGELEPQLFSLLFFKKENNNNRKKGDFDKLVADFKFPTLE